MTCLFKDEARGVGFLAMAEQERQFTSETNIPMRGHECGEYGLVFVGDAVYWADANGSIHMADEIKRKVSIAWVGTGTRVSSLYAHSDGISILFISAAGAGDAMIIDTKTNSVTELNANVGSDRVTSICSGFNGQVITGHDSGTLRIWNGATFQCLSTYLSRSETVMGRREIHTVRFEPVTMKIATVSLDRAVWVWDYNTGNHDILVDHNQADVFKATSAQFIDSDFLVTATLYGRINVWKLSTLRNVKQLVFSDYVTQGSIHDIAVARDREHIIAVNTLGVVKVFNLSTCQCTATILNISASGIQSLALSADGGYFATAYDDGVSIYNIFPPFKFVVRESIDPKLVLFSDGSFAGDMAAIAGFDEADKGLWKEAIDAVAADMAREEDNREKSADNIIFRYRFEQLETILFHSRDRTRDLRLLVPRDLLGKMAGYLFNKD